MHFRYSRWDGTQEIGELDADDLLAAMADDILADGDARQALRRLLQRGMQGPQQMRGLQDLLEQLRRRRQQQLDRYDLDSVLDDLKQKLDEVVRTERAGIEQRLTDARERAQRGEAPPSFPETLEKLAAEKRQTLDGLPPDPGGQLTQLQKYEFMDPEAWRLFQELLRSLRQQMLQPFLKGMQQALQGMSKEDLQRMREMVQDLNRMLREHARGGEPDFQGFMDKWGQHFPGVESLEQLMEQMARQMAQMQALLQSMSPEQRGQLENLLRASLLQDERLEAALSQLGMTLGEIFPLDELARQQRFRGDDSVTLDEAMKLMDELAQLDQLERQVKGAHSPGDLDKISPEDVERLLGPDAAQDLSRLRDIAKKLEEAGYLEQKGGRLELTARAMRKIGDKALTDIFTRLARDRFGRHAVDHRGAGGDRTDEAKRYEFGDPFLLDLRETLMNAVARSGTGTPVRLRPDDFQVFRTELATQAATVVMLDMSLSMIYNGCFFAAKKVALALSALIRDQFPRDSLSIIGFSLMAREFTIAQLPTISWAASEKGTNMHAGFALARQLLGRHPGSNKQIIMITDGEPTAHLENGQPVFAYPTIPRTIQETLREVRRCTRDGIVINTFMLERSDMLTSFVNQMARINRGRAFFATPERLGEYVLVDYVNNKGASSRRSAGA